MNQSDVVIDRPKLEQSIPGPGALRHEPEVSSLRPAWEVQAQRQLDQLNLARKANWKGMAFIGDAALSLDPLSGVGCAFAMVGASLLANATTVPLLQESGLDDGLAAYEAQFAKVILPHARGIHADSLIAKSEATSLQTYRCIAGDPILQRQFVDLTGRLISPMAFQRAFTSAMVRAHLAVH